MAKSKQGGFLLFLLCLFLGWLGIDKLVKGSVKLFLIKLLLNLLIVGEIWNIVDCVMCLFRNYRLNPLDYFK